MTNEELCIAIQSGSVNRDEALLQLYNKNIRLIERITWRYSSIEEQDDLKQEAFFGIAKAADLWNQDKNCSFTTYAAYWVKAVIIRYIEECSGVIRIPSQKRVLMARCNREENRYRARFGKDPSDTELCAVLDLTPEQLQKLKAEMQAARIRSTSEVISNTDDDLTLEDTIADECDQYESVIDQIQHEQLSKELWSCVDDLKSQQAKVVRGHYKEGRTLKECGAALGVTTERARQIEQDALRELRKPRLSKRLRPYLTERGAYSMGLKNIGLSSFEQYGSSQERAMMLLEQMSGMSLW